MKMLKVDGNKIVNPEGQEIKLRGTCIGGWMNLENFINGFPGSEIGLRSAMASTLGSSKAEFLFDRMLTHFFNEDDIAFLRDSGATVIRIPLNYRHFENDMAPFTYIQSGFDRLDRIVGLCKKYGIYAILDLHAVQGWQNAHWHSDNPKGLSLLWDNIQFQDRFVALWEEFARRYAGRPEIAGYNIMNEPCVNTAYGDYPYNFFECYKPVWDKINSLYRRVVNAIRQIDSEHIIFLEGDDYSRLFNGLDRPFTDNLVYSSHNYTSAGFGPGVYPGEFKTHRPDREIENGFWDRKKQLEVFKLQEGYWFSVENRVPLWVGEFGSQYNCSEEEIPYRLHAMNDQLDVFHELGAHWTTWTYKDVGVMGWVTLDPDSDYMQMIAPVQKMKNLLGAENFTGRFTVSPAKKAVKELAALMEEVTGNKEVNSTSNQLCLAQNALTSYAAGLLEPEFAKLFKGLSEERIDDVMRAFSFNKCNINHGLDEILRKQIRK